MKETLIVPLIVPNKITKGKGFLVSFRIKDGKKLKMLKSLSKRWEVDIRDAIVKIVNDNLDYYIELKKNEKKS